MKKPTRQDRKGKSAAGHSSRGNGRRIIFLLAVAGVLLVAGVGYLKSRNAGNQSASSPTQTGFQQLKGRWRRSDAAYVIDIKGVDGSGRIEASYFNPRSIHVARAEASQQGASLRVAIELRDEGYPGSTYDLTYDESSGVLRGKYYQAAIKETFDVVFVRS